ncbi:MAG TPA: GxxExxY protein [Blastocatellia bacterium]|jgi:GxxExxY protein
MALKHENLTGQIIKAFYKVYNELGYGFLEKVYEKALALELASSGLRVGRQQPIKGYYLGQQEERSSPTTRSAIEQKSQK